VNSEGQALNNAAIAQNARVRMSSGQVVSGVVSADGNVLINLYLKRWYTLLSGKTRRQALEKRHSPAVAPMTYGVFIIMQIMF